ncbi:hypothetical protein EFK13_14385 [Bacillus cabrialesii]|nr:hypothetical protein [Bacillus cabrialesii]UQE77939.1 hypothetical protein EFK13_14385 [Bacillus cabrialesii]
MSSTKDKRKLHKHTDRNSILKKIRTKVILEQLKNCSGILNMKSADEDK